MPLRIRATIAPPRKASLRHRAGQAAIRDDQCRAADRCPLFVDPKQQRETGHDHAAGHHPHPRGKPSGEIEQKQIAEEHRHIDPIATLGLIDEKLAVGGVDRVPACWHQHPQDGHENEGSDAERQNGALDQPCRRPQPTEHAQEREVVSERPHLDGCRQRIEEPRAELHHRNERRQAEGISQPDHINRPALQLQPRQCPRRGRQHNHRPHLGQIIERRDRQQVIEALSEQRQGADHCNEAPHVALGCGRAITSDRQCRPQAG